MRLLQHIKNEPPKQRFPPGAFSCSRPLKLIQEGGILLAKVGSVAVMRGPSRGSASRFSVSGSSCGSAPRDGWRPSGARNELPRETRDASRRCSAASGRAQRPTASQGCAQPFPWFEARQCSKERGSDAGRVPTTRGVLDNGGVEEVPQLTWPGQNAMRQDSLINQTR